MVYGKPEPHYKSRFQAINETTVDAAYSITIMSPKISASKKETEPMLLAKPPRKVPRESRKRPPQANIKFLTDPSVLAFTQGTEGAFQTTGIMSRTRLCKGETNRFSKITTSENKQ